MSTIVEMLVHMDCAGCERKIRKYLQKLDGVDDIEIDMAMQKVTVMGSADQEKVLKAVRKTGRRAELWPYPYNPEYHDFARQYYYNGTGFNHHGYTHQPEHDLGRDDNHDDDDNDRHKDDYYYYQTSNGEAAASMPSPSFSYKYNYYRHGYEGGGYGYYQQPPYSAIVGEEASSLFNDENPSACSIM